MQSVSLRSVCIFLMLSALLISQTGWTDEASNDRNNAVVTANDNTAALSDDLQSQRSRAVKRLTALLKNTKAFSADFEQSLTDQRGVVLQRVSGELKAQRPGKFYWYTQPPLEQTIVTDGKTVWLYDPDLEQVTVQPLSQQVAATPALLLSGEVEQIEQHYEVSQINTGSDKDSDKEKEKDNVSAFQLIPKGQDSLFESLLLVFRNEKLSSMALTDSLGQKTRLILSEAKINPKLDDTTFKFVIPPGIDVIQGQMPQ